MWLSDLSIKRPVFVTMVTIALMVVGWISYTRMPVDLFPNFSVPVVVVRTIYPGATPQEVESSLSQPVERAVSSLNRVKNVRSTSNESVSVVMVEFDTDYDSKQAADEVRQRVESMKGTLPADANDPDVLRYDPASTPIMLLAVSDSSGSLDSYRLRTLVEDEVSSKLERVPGVASVTVSGGLQRQVQVNLQLTRLQALMLPVQQVISAIKQENVNIPGGRLNEGSQERLVRSAGEFTSVDQLASVPIQTPSGATVYLRDIAEVKDGYMEVRSTSRFDGKDSVLVSILKQSGTNTVSVADGVKAKMEEIKASQPQLNLAIVDDQSVFTRESTVDVMVTLVIGAILAALVVLAFFRNFRNTLVTVAGLPVIVLGSFVLMSSLGFSLNMITLMALSLSIGMLVDDAIVVRENIFRHTEEGEHPRLAASKATAEIALAVLATSFTIVAVFAPIAFTSGIAGRFLREFGLTVVIAVLLSLFEAFTLAPMLSAYFFRPSRKPREEATHRSGAYGRLDSYYRRVLGWALRHRLAIVLVGLVSLVGSGIFASILERSFIRDFDRGDLTVNLEMPPGTSLTEMDAAARQAEKMVMAVPYVERVVTSVGSDDGTTETGWLKVHLKERGLLDRFQSDVRPQLATLSRVRFNIDMQANSLAGMLSSSASNVRGRPLQLQVRGDDLASIDYASRQVLQALSRIPGVVDIDRSLKSGRPELRIVMDRERAADLGVSTAQVGATVRALVNGEVASTLRGTDKDIDILVRLQQADRDSAVAIEQLPLLTPKGRLVPLSAVANLEPGSGPAQIDRLNRQREVTVGASYLGRQLGEVTNDAHAAIDKLPLPKGVTVTFGGTTTYMEEAFSSLIFALLLSILFVYMILASQFGSFVHPFTIMLALPLSFLGAFFSLWASGQSLDMVSLIGVILLMGLVTKNSILLVDYTNTLRGRGLARDEALLTAGPVRLRPILMTTIAMIFGMVPIALGYGAGAEVRQPMAIAVIGGLTTSTILTLVVVPVAYSLIDDLTGVFRRLFASRQPLPAAGGSDGDGAAPA
ncbi:MAG: efflux RND transporter permease subunit [Chloroflexi bacterium]|nr:efflux RND transporter permease subunit [Chloroflexota bacterium]